MEIAIACMILMILSMVAMILSKEEHEKELDWSDFRILSDGEYALFYYRPEKKSVIARRMYSKDLGRWLQDNTDIIDHYRPVLKYSTNIFGHKIERRIYLQFKEYVPEVSEVDEEAR